MNNQNLESLEFYSSFFRIISLVIIFVSVFSISWIVYNYKQKQDYYQIKTKTKTKQDNNHIFTEEIYFDIP